MIFASCFSAVYMQHRCIVLFVSCIIGYESIRRQVWNFFDLKCGFVFNLLLWTVGLAVWKVLLYV